MTTDGRLSFSGVYIILTHKNFELFLLLKYKLSSSIPIIIMLLKMFFYFSIYILQSVIKKQEN